MKIGAPRINDLRVFSLRGGVIQAIGRAVLPLAALSLTCALSAQSNYATPYTFKSFAGTVGSPGALDATGAAARFNIPYAIARDGAGNFYVADTNSHTIRKITPGGIVTTLAGLAGAPGSTDGTGGAARFNAPRGVTVDTGGNVYVADTQNSTIRKITPGGLVTTLAGTAGNVGSLDGTGAAAQFRNPWGVAADATGNVFVADTSNNAIRKITTGGVVTTLAGLPGSSGPDDGTGSAARFYGPQGLTIDGAGTLFVADTYNHAIRMVTTDGTVTTLAGGSSGAGDGTGSAAQFNFPGGVAVDAAGNVWVADTQNGTMRLVTPAGVVTTVAGTAGQFGAVDGTGAAAQFYYSFGVAVDGAGDAYVADSLNSIIRKVTTAGVVTTFAGTAPYGDGDGTGSAAAFYYPAGTAVDTGGNVYVADTYNHTIRKITAAGVVTTLAGLPGVPGSADGTGSVARFNFPNSVAVDGSGNVYVADSSNCVIRKITPGGDVTTIAGTAGSPGSINGIGPQARFSSAMGIAVDGGGTVYVADTGNHLIRKISSGVVVTTFAGAVNSHGSTDGTGVAAKFYFPTTWRWTRRGTFMWLTAPIAPSARSPLVPW